MVDFKVVVNDTKNGKSYQIPVTGHHANSLIGKKIGDVVEVSVPSGVVTFEILKISR